jgi:butyrate kinase
MYGKKILVINPGSTSTKIAVYEGTRSVFMKIIIHEPDELKGFKRVVDQYEFRKSIIIKELKDAEIELSQISLVMGRGGLMKPVESGVYEVNQKMKDDLINSAMGEHASNLGALIADDIAHSLPKARAFIADPVVVDELQDVARITGHPKFEKRSIFHALNQKAIARAYAGSLHVKYEDLNLIVAHMGGGITVGAHCKGRVIDVNQGLDGDGPFSPERSGTLPMGQLVDLCFSNQFTREEVRKMITGEGGYVAYLGTNNSYNVEVRANNGDAYASEIQRAMAYQVGKEIGAMCATLHGKVDAIILTGGIAHNHTVVELISEMVSFICPVIVYPGEDEMKQLAMNGFMLLRGEIQIKEYR